MTLKVCRFTVIASNKSFHFAGQLIEGGQLDFLAGGFGDFMAQAWFKAGAGG